MRRTTVAMTTALMGAALLAPTASAAAGETCRGLAATIVGTSGRIVGTPGPDVVVSRGAQTVDLRGGDDVLCVRDGKRSGGLKSVLVTAGPGNDVVDGTAARAWTISATLGPGSDRFEGGPRGDEVSAGEWGGEDYTHIDIERDVLIGRGGNDQFDSGTTGEPNPDVIDLGRGNDSLDLVGTKAPGGSITGGRGNDHLSLIMTGTTALVDNAIGRFVDQGQTGPSWASMERFYVARSSDEPHNLTFLGSSADESLSSYGDNIRLTARFRGGSDELFTEGLPAPGSTMNGGSGRDLIDVTSSESSAGPVTLDLRAGRLTSGSGTPVTTTATGFEDAWVLANSRVELSGTSRANRLSAASCNGFVRGRGGDDRVTHPDKLSFLNGCGRARFVMSGGRGNDHLTGGARNDRILGGPGHDLLRGRSRNDVLLGGPGRDTANGGPGRDRCVAEVRRQCEQR